MEILFILAVSWLVTVKAGGQTARDWQLAKKGRLPPDAQARIKAMETAEHLATNGMSPEEAFRAMRKQPGAAGAYWRRLKDDTFDAMREKHQAKDAKRREKRRQKAEGTYRPGAFENFAFDLKDSAWGRWDRAWDKASDWRQNRRQQRETQQPTDPHPDPDPGSGPEPKAETPPTGSTGPNIDPLPPDPQPARELEPPEPPAPTGTPASAGVLDSGAVSDQQPGRQPEPAWVEPASAPVSTGFPTAGSAPLPGPDSLNDAAEPEPESETGPRSELVVGAEAGARSSGGEPAGRSDPDGPMRTSPAATTTTMQPMQEEQAMADGMTTPGNTSAGGAVGEITSQRQLARCEQIVGDKALALADEAERMAATLSARNMPITDLVNGREQLMIIGTRWSAKAQEHDQGATAAIELRGVHQGWLADDLNFDVDDN